MSLKVFRDEEDDDNDKFYPKLSQAQTSNYLEIWLFWEKKENIKKIILKRIIGLPM